MVLKILTLGLDLCIIFHNNTRQALTFFRINSSDIKSKRPGYQG